MLCCFFVLALSAKKVKCGMSLCSSWEGSSRKAGRGFPALRASDDDDDDDDDDETTTAMTCDDGDYQGSSP